MALSLSKRNRVSRKVERVEARLKPEQKRRIERAAILKGTSLSDFIIDSADDMAIRTIQEHETWTLRDKDRDVFMNAFLNPPSPTSRMKTAVARYKKRTRAS
jgi:uncharacterized protein (DUF1778 family)